MYIYIYTQIWPHSLSLSEGRTLGTQGPWPSGAQGPWGPIDQKSVENIDRKFVEKLTTKQSTRNSTKNVRRIFLNLYCKIINFYGALMRSEILLNSGFIPQICGVFVRRIFVKAFVEKNHNFYIRKTILSKAGEKP